MKNDNFSNFFFNISQKIQYSKFQGKTASRPAHGVCDWNKIINFVLSVKLGEEIGFLQGPLKAYIFYANRFLDDLRKKSKNKNVLFYSFKNFLFRRFFSKMVNKTFFWGGDHLKLDLNICSHLNSDRFRNLLAITLVNETLCVRFKLIWLFQTSYFEIIYVIIVYFTIIV